MNASAAKSDPQVALDPSKLVHLLASHLRLLLFCAAAGFLAALVYVFYRPPVYVSQALLDSFPASNHAAMDLLYPLPASCRRLWEKCQDSSLPILPVLVGYALRRMRGRNLLCAPNTKIHGLANITATGLTQIGMHHIGFMHADDATYIRVRGSLHLKGNNHIGRGSRIDIGPAARCTLTDAFLNARCLVVVETELTVGAGSQIGWDVMLIDGNFHSIDYPGRKPRAPGITVGRQVWIGARATLLSGATVADGCVVAAGAVVVGRFEEPRTLIAGNPARVVRRDVTWHPDAPDSGDENANGHDSPLLNEHPANPARSRYPAPSPAIRSD